MNKDTLIEAVHEKLDGTKRQAEEVVDLVFDKIKEALKKDEKVSIAGFGIFRTKTRAARRARNPRTGEMVNVPAMKAVKFRPGKALNQEIRQ